MAKTGAVRFVRNANRVISKMDDVAVKRMKRATFIVRNEILDTLTGTRTGRTYDTYFYTDPQGRVRPVGRRSRPHTASAPGEAPATDRGELRSSYKTEVKASGRRLTGVVGSDLEKAKRLELGHIRGRSDEGTQLPADKARPHLEPSFKRALPAVKRELSRKWF